MIKRARIRRLLAIYDKKTEKLVRDHELKGLNLAELRKVFDLGARDPMYYCYRVTEKEAPYFRKKHGLRFHFKKREYFLETRKF